MWHRVQLHTVQYIDSPHCPQGQRAVLSFVCMICPLVIIVIDITIELHFLHFRPSVWLPVPSVATYCIPYGPWSKEVHYIRNMVPFGMLPMHSFSCLPGLNGIVWRVQLALDLPELSSPLSHFLTAPERALFSAPNSLGSHLWAL